MAAFDFWEMLLNASRNRNNRSASFLFTIPVQTNAASCKIFCWTMFFFPSLATLMILFLEWDSMVLWFACKKVQ